MVARGTERHPKIDGIDQCVRMLGAQHQPQAYECFHVQGQRKLIKLMVAPRTVD